jgi:trans-2,3-dihydro-3-hydroxyanthranilate isomerase
MGALVFSFVDVFAEDKYAGNPLAVVRPAKGLETEAMQKIAREFNFSETAFILGGRASRGGFDVRIFTPARELPFAGHPTLGTAFVIQQDLIKEPVPKVVLNLKVGPIPVTFSYRGRKPDVLWMRQIAPRFGLNSVCHRSRQDPGGGEKKRPQAEPAGRADRRRRKGVPLVLSRGLSTRERP